MTKDPLEKVRAAIAKIDARLAELRSKQEQLPDVRAREERALLAHSRGEGPDPVGLSEQRATLERQARGWELEIAELMKEREVLLPEWQALSELRDRQLREQEIAKLHAEYDDALKEQNRLDAELGAAMREANRRGLLWRNAMETYRQEQAQRAMTEARERQAREWAARRAR